jgi:hypothetical protein
LLKIDFTFKVDFHGAHPTARNTISAAQDYQPRFSISTFIRYCAFVTAYLNVCLAND